MRRVPATIATVLVAALSMACNPSAGNRAGDVTTTFGGNKKLVLAADYLINTTGISIGAWADVSVGTAGILELTGPLHMRCQGQFVPPDPQSLDPYNLPHLTFGDGGLGAGLHAPPGHYTASVTLPSANASVRKSFDARDSLADAITGIYELPAGCLPVADSAQQLSTLLALYVTAVDTWIVRMDSSPLRTQLSQLSTNATHALASGDHPAARQALTQIVDLVQPLVAQNPYYAIQRDALGAIGLLNQPAPAS
jgi:hypothetical protein